MCDIVSILVMRQLLIQILEVSASPLHACEIGELRRNHMPREGEPALSIIWFVCQDLGLARAAFDGIEEVVPLSKVLKFFGRRNTEEAC